MLALAFVAVANVLQFSKRKLKASRRTTTTIATTTKHPFIYLLSPVDHTASQPACLPASVVAVVYCRLSDASCVRHNESESQNAEGTFILAIVFVAVFPKKRKKNRRVAGKDFI